MSQICVENMCVKGLLICITQYCYHIGECRYNIIFQQTMIIFYILDHLSTEYFNLTIDTWPCFRLKLRRQFSGSCLSQRLNFGSFLDCSITQDFERQIQAS